MTDLAALTQIPGPRLIDGATINAIINSLQGDGNIELASAEYSDSGSFQTIAGDLNLGSAATGGYLAGMMGNVLGDAIGSTGGMTAGLIGSYNITTSNGAQVKAGVIGEVGDLASNAQAAVMAVLGGDGGALTPGAAFGVRCLNSTAASKFSYGLDLYSAAIGSYQPVSYGTADLRFSSGGLFVSLTTAITANSTTTSLAAGTLGKTTHATGVASLFRSDGTKWQYLVNA